MKNARDPLIDSHGSRQKWHPTTGKFTADRISKWRGSQQM